MIGQKRLLISGLDRLFQLIGFHFVLIILDHVDKELLQHLQSPKED